MRSVGEGEEDTAEIVPMSASNKPPDSKHQKGLLTVDVAKKGVGPLPPPHPGPAWKEVSPTTKSPSGPHFLGGDLPESSNSGTLAHRDSWMSQSRLSSNGIPRMPAATEHRRSDAGKKWVSRLRHRIHHAGWYHSPAAVRLRAILHGQRWGIIMTLLLFVALFMPDAWILGGANNNSVIDTILSVVMFVFLIEIATLSVFDTSYLLSFFFLMDIIGTITMIFDISTMFGPDNTEVVYYSGDGGSKNNLMLLRATRAARVGARAGRLSRVLRVLRFLPFLKSKHTKEEQGGMAGNISAQLANLLATRVACLTIVLVIIIPLFDLLMFPQNDHSLRTWTERASRIYSDPNLDATTKTNMILEVLKKMKSYYHDRYTYGPYRACGGHRKEGEDGFICVDTYQGFVWEKTAPSRAASTWEVSTDTFMVAFNMGHPIQVDSILAIGTIIFIMCLMIFSGLVLSSVVTELAVRPLERMLKTVKHIAMTVFKFAAEKQEDPEEEETYDIDSSSEMKLLEKVVAKLAIIANLQAESTTQVDTKGMQEEDIGIINMMKGVNVVEEKRKQDRRSVAVVRRNAFTPAVKLEDFGMSQDVFNSWKFNTLALSKPQKINLAMFHISTFHETGDGYVNTDAEVATLRRFIECVESEYYPQIFHNFSHAVDVLHALARTMRIIESQQFLMELEQFALLIAAVSHDLGHPGVNNAFLCETGHELALQYNDRSPLENMHCAKLYAIVKNKEVNVFANLSREQYKEVRTFCIETILHTDMIGHNAMVKELQLVYEVKSEIFATSNEGRNNPAVAEVFNQADTKILVMNNLLHSADVSNPCRTWEVCYPWAMQVLEEFFSQGDQEKQLGVPVGFLNDRDKLNRPNSQIGFLEFMIVPYFASQIRLWPQMAELGQNLGSNLGRWEEMWKTETSPTEEEARKVHNRVVKAQDMLEQAESCRRSSKTALAH
mmetsp:Transcript_79888/g.125970  ORF Transcript_79888/g.125970 Transcript_79888/m.125970 type:complete len:949 (+) Transcript_79888:286-3132(+)